MIDRRTALGFLGVGTIGPLAGCLDAETTDVDVTAVETVPFAVRSATPRWYDDADDGPTGHAVVVDSQRRAEAILGDRWSDVPDGRRDDLREFVESIDYDTERLVLVESAGPTACHDVVEIADADVRLDDDRLTADATVVDTADPGDMCAQVVVFPSALLWVSFDGPPVDRAAIDVTDGWGRRSTVLADVDDLLPPDPADLPGYVAPVDDPRPVSPLVCDDERFQRHPQEFDEADLQRGEYERGGETVLAMRVDAIEYGRGDTVAVQLTNVTDEPVETGSREKYNVQVYTEEGWQDVRGADETPFPYTDEAVVHPPGEAFEWSFGLTEAGVVEDAASNLRVCPSLPEGRYRFAYWGVVGSGAVAVEFDLRG